MVRIRVHFYGRRKRAVITDVNTGFDPRNDGKRTDVNVTADVYLAFVSKAANVDSSGSSSRAVPSGENHHTPIDPGIVLNGNALRSLKINAAINPGPCTEMFESSFPIMGAEAKSQGTGHILNYPQPQTVQ